ncbi:MAG TPA: N-acetylmuramoyl-L-alanine amidase [Longimicrobium sp.]|uniref:N-acetylmuramoyl-L-alanine amidase n=1 Tax=Longimicrobium sp. TaxID=2029185 RepID=UPI002ED9C264
MRVLATLLFLFAAASAAAVLPAQTPGAWRLASGTDAVSVAEATDRGYPALPVSALVNVGAQVAYEGGEVIVRMGARTFALRVDSPGVRVDGQPRMLASPTYARDGVVYVPTAFLALLGEPAGGPVWVDVDARTLRVDPGALAAAAARPAPAAAPAPAAGTPATPPRRRLIVVDAGHGGVDPGAQGPSGTREKHINLRIARRVAEILSADPSYEVRMTRDRDTLIALRDRGRMANAWRDEGQPALFMSIHCNANPSRAEAGYETYFLAEARTADARRVQAMEDAAAQYEERPAGHTPLDFIMNDLRQNQHLRESSDWAQMIQNRLREVHPGRSRGVKQAGFAVLVGAFMPAVLVEIGFISNHREEAMLTDPEQQERIAQQLAQSVRDFFDASERRQSARD